MLKILATLVISSVFLALPVFADPIDPDRDGIGVYFDPCACVNCVPMEPGVHMGFVVITHPTSDSVGGWEARVSWDGPAIVGNWEVMGTAVNFLNPPQFYVGIGTPIYNPFTYPAVIAARFELQLTSDAVPVHFYIDGIFEPSLESGQPAYLDGDDYNIIKPLQQPTGGPDIPVSTINGDCAVPVEDMTWGSVKSLFR